MRPRRPADRPGFRRRSGTPSAWWDRRDRSRSPVRWCRTRRRRRRRDPIRYSVCGRAEHQILRAVAVDVADRDGREVRERIVVLTATSGATVLMSVMRVSGPITPPVRSVSVSAIDPRPPAGSAVPPGSLSAPAMMLVSSNATACAAHRQRRLVAGLDAERDRRGRVEELGHQLQRRRRRRRLRSSRPRPRRCLAFARRTRRRWR